MWNTGLHYSWSPELILSTLSETVVHISSNLTCYIPPLVTGNGKRNSACDFRLHLGQHLLLLRARHFTNSLPIRQSNEQAGTLRNCPLRASKMCRIHTQFLHHSYTISTPFPHHFCTISAPFRHIVGNIIIVLKRSLCKCYKCVEYTIQCVESTFQNIQSIPKEILSLMPAQ